jgi:prophage regulatory protein
MPDSSPSPEPASRRSPIRQVVRRTELRRIVPLADTTIYELEQKGEFPRRFYLTPRCVVWDLAEVQAWLASRREASEQDRIALATPPDVTLRRTRPVHSRESRLPSDPRRHSRAV